MKAKKQIRNGNDSEDGVLGAVLVAAVLAALDRHRRLGHSVAEWQDGRVVWIEPEQIAAAVERSDQACEGGAVSVKE